MSRTEEKNEEKVQGRRFLEYLYMKIPVWSLLMSASVRVRNWAKRGAVCSLGCEEVQIRITLF